MIRVGFILILCMIGLFGSSQTINSVYFENPQPLNTKNTSSFSADVIGRYYKATDNIIDLVIDSTKIEVKYLVKMLLRMDEIKSNDKYYIKNNLLYGVNEKKGLEFFVKNDTVYFGVFQTETFFEQTDSSFIRKIGNKYVLNEKKEDAWDVTVLYKKDTTLYIRTIDLIEEEEKVNKYLAPLTKKVINKEHTYISNPSVKKMKSFVSAKGFYDIIKYHVKLEEE